MELFKQFNMQSDFCLGVVVNADFKRVLDGETIELFAKFR